MVEKDNIRIHIGASGLTINVCGTSFNPNWRQTKDLHPKAYMLDAIYDYIDNINFERFRSKRKPSILLDSGGYLELPLNDKLEEISKLKNDWRLFNILVGDYINSLEGFEYFIDKIYNDEILLLFRENQNIRINS